LFSLSYIKRGREGGNLGRQHNEQDERNENMARRYCRIDIERCAEYTEAEAADAVNVCVIGDRPPETYAGGDDKIVGVMFSVYGRNGNRENDYPGLAEHLADFACPAQGLDVAQALAKGFGVELAVGFDPLLYGVEEFQPEVGRLGWDPEAPIRVVVSAINANGDADFYFVKVACTREQFEEGEHYEAAKAQAEAEGYGNPMLAYDEEDSAGRAIMEHFAWETASVVPCQKDRLFIGAYPGGLVYSDRGEEVDGDYKRLAFLDYATLTLKLEDGCGADMAARIQRSAAELQGRAGEEFSISATGGSVILGSELAQTAAEGIKP
jgi:hypothetical protein